MGNLSNAKTLGGVGALLALIGGFLPIGPVFSIIGLVMIFLSVKSLSEITKDENIFNNYLYHFLLSIIAIIAIFIIALIGFGAIGGFEWIQTLQDNIEITNFESFWNYFGGLFIYLLLALFVGWILAIIGAVFLRRSYNQIAQHTKVNLFKTTGTLYFFGALSLIVLVGFLILFIAKILEVIAYFSLPDDLPIGEINQRRCPSCDRIIPEDARICPYCGNNFS